MGNCCECTSCAPKYSEKALLRVCCMAAAVIIIAIGAIAYCVGKILDDIT